MKSTITKDKDGTIRVVFSIPFSQIKKAREKVVKEEARNVTIPGFRKGKAPLEKVMGRIPQKTLIERIVSKFYSKFLKEIVEIHKIKPATYPRVEISKINEGEPWEVNAITCELPDIKISDYRKTTLEIKVKKGATREEKEQAVLNALLKNTQIDIPKMLIEDEVNARLSKLLEKIEKLGLSLEGYLQSLGKTPETLRTEYQTQARDSLALDLILSEIANKENIKVDDSQVDEALKAASADPKLILKLNTPEQKATIRDVLTKRKVLDSLVALL